MDTYSKLQAVAVFLTAVLGVIVTLWPPDGFKLKLIFLLAFYVALTLPMRRYFGALIRAFR